MNGNFTYNITTINICRIQSELKFRTLKDFLYNTNVDIGLLQEVSVEPNVEGFVTLTNISEEDHTGTAILLRDGIPHSHIVRLTNGRGIACKINGVQLINLYAPSGNNRRRERSSFYKHEVPFLINECATNCIIGGDFNCVISAKDQTPHFNKCLELDHLVHGINLIDTWQKYMETASRIPI